MRDCPVCNSPFRSLVDGMYEGYNLYACECGMRYVDLQFLDQNWMNAYYLTAYQTDDKPYSDERLDSLARYIAGFEPRSVLDIGGMDRELQTRLVALGIPCEVDGVEWQHFGKYDVVVLSHTLEHIYDVSSFLKRLQNNMGNRLIVEVPIWLDYDNLSYDRHWQHINKFTVSKLEELFIRRGFQVLQSAALPDYREYHCHRLVVCDPQS